MSGFIQLVVLTALMSLVMFYATFSIGRSLGLSRRRKARDECSQLKDHIVLVTGALGTLGSAMCKAIEAAGGTAIRSDLAARGKVDIALDVTKEEDWKAAMADDRAHARPPRRPRQQRRRRHARRRRADAASAEWRRVMAINADGVFLGCKYAMPLLAKSKAPSIVNISSASGIVAGANLAAYNASKGAVRMLSKSVALSGARKRPPVRCNSVHPAFIEGDMVDAMVKGRPDPGQGAWPSCTPRSPSAASASRRRWPTRSSGCCRRPPRSRRDRKCWSTAA